MPNFKELNLKITSLQNTKKITQVMKLISATKFHKAQQSVLKSQNYLKELERLGNIINNDHNIVIKDPILLDNNDTEKEIAVVLFTSNKGLCGGFNNNVIQAFLKFYQQKKSENIKVNCYLLGKKGYDAIKSKIPATDIVYVDQEIMKLASYSESKRFFEEQLVEKFLSKKIQKFYFIYNHFQSTIKQVPLVEQVLPYTLKKEELEGDVVQNNHSDLYLFEPQDKEAIYNSLIVKMFYLNIYDIFLNMFAGEHASRMQAMDQATKNGEEMIKTASLQRNRMRQAAITTELTEIVAGAEALK